jgi:hypothetical protein
MYSNYYLWCIKNNLNRGSFQINFLYLFIFKFKSCFLTIKEKYGLCLCYIEKNKLLMRCIQVFCIELKFNLYILLYFFFAVFVRIFFTNNPIFFLSYRTSLLYKIWQKNVWKLLSFRFKLRSLYNTSNKTSNFVFC